METPYYMINKEDLQKNVDDLREAIGRYWGRHIIGYSFKTNSLPWLVRHFKDSGFYAEVVSGDEYQLSALTGFDKHKVIYNGPCKDRETFLEAVRSGCIVNIDSKRELDWLKELNSSGGKYQVGLRVNFDLEKHCPGESTMGNEGGRFGFCLENGEFQKAIDLLERLENIKLAGIHLHSGSKTRSLNVYRAISRMACKIKETFGLELDYVDIGGGFYGGLKDKPQFNDYLEVISEELGKAFDRESTTLILEPGTSLVSSPFSYVTRVTDVKDTTVSRFAVTDGSRIHIDPLMKKNKYSYRIESSSSAERLIVEKQVITGFTCIEDDRLFVLENHPELAQGDYVIYEKVGAYTMCLAPLFIRYYPAVYVKDGERFYTVREKWTAEEYVAKSKLQMSNFYSEEGLV